MSVLFRFSPTSSIAINTISKISELSKESIYSTNLSQINGGIHNSNKIDQENNVEKREKEDKNPNGAIIKLLENKKNDLKKNIEILSIELRRHIHQVEYIDSRICELKGEKVELQSSKLASSLRLDTELYQTSFSRLSTTINTGINTPSSELAGSNEIGVRNTFFSYKMERDWVIVPEFKEIVSKAMNLP